MEPTPFFAGKSVLITGGTGSLGNQLVERILPHGPKRLIVFSRDELKQSEMRMKWPDDAGSPMRYFIGDVRDRDRLRRAFDGVDVVIHAAAMKQVPACTYNPDQAVAVNIQGTMNVINAAIDATVKQVLLISSDKSVSATNLYGKTKAVAEDLVIQANAYSPGGTRFSVCRYGNVVGSRGSVAPLFMRQRETGTITVTDTRMTRFWMTLPEAFTLIEHSLTHMRGGEIFIPKLPSTRIPDLATAVAPGCIQQITGIRPGEKLHESLLSEEETSHCLDAGDVYVVQPLHPWWTTRAGEGKPLPAGFQYTSEVNTWWLTVDELRDRLQFAPGYVGVR